MRRLVFLGLLLRALAGCADEITLPPCDMDAAREVVFLDAPSDVTADDGIPMYAGQALLHVGCGGNAYCHSAEANDIARVSVPGGYDFVTGVPCGTSAEAPGVACDPSDPALRGFSRRLERVRKEGKSLIRTLQNGTMPPGAVGRTVTSEARVGRVVRVSDPDFDLGAGTPLPSIDSEEGLAIFANWIACGAPAVQTALSPDASHSPGDPCATAPDDPGDCVTRVAAAPVALAPTWDAIWSELLEPLCAESCHGPRFPSAGDFGSKAHFFEWMHEESCEERPIVAPGDPDGSALIHTLLGDARACESVMPPGLLSGRLPDATIDAVRAWIEGGALP
jgi:hypothetical protein